MSLPSFNTNVPVYVTNETAEGLVMTYSTSVYFAFFLFRLILLNMAVWGILGLYEAVKVIQGIY